MSEALLNEEESRHCIKVLRHKRGDVVNFVDGAGGLYGGEIVSDKDREVRLRIVSYNPDYERRNYYLHMAVAPTKNMERYEWFIEKAVELGVDEITPVVGDHSERRIFKRERGERIILSAMKQSLKARLPKLNDLMTVSQFIESYSSAGASSTARSACPVDCIKLFGHCREGEKQPFITVLSEIKRSDPHIVMMIGPEGDFSVPEIEYALDSGFIAVQMGDSRMRVETAALTAVGGIYLLSENFN